MRLVHGTSCVAKNPDRYFLGNFGTNELVRR